MRGARYPLGMTQPTPGAFGRILVGVDFSPASDHALAVVRARFPQAQRCLVHVTDARAVAAPDLMGGLTPVLPDPALLNTLGAQVSSAEEAPHEDAPHEDAPHAEAPPEQTSVEESTLEQAPQPGPVEVPAQVTGRAARRRRRRRADREALAARSRTAPRDGHDA